MDFGPVNYSQGRINWRGAWSSVANYSPNDAVSAAGSSYIAIANSINISVANTLYWSIMCSAGGVFSVAGRVGSITLSSADLSDGNTGTGTVVHDTSPTIATPTLTSPTLVTPALGVATATAINGVQMVDNSNTAGWSGSNAGAWIASAIAALPAAGGIVDATGLGANVHTISAQLDIGAAGKPVTLLINPNTRFQITTISSSTTDAIRIWNGSNISGIGAGGCVGNGDQANFTVQSGCTVRSIIANWPQDGTQEFCSAQNLTLRSNTGSTVAKGLLYISGIFAGSYFRDIYTVFNGGGGSSLFLTSPATGTLLLTSDVNFYNCNFDGGNATAGGPAVTIQCGGATSGLESINFTDCQIQHAGNNQPDLKIDGNGSGQLGSIKFNGLHFESGAGLTTVGPYATINDAHGIWFHDVNTSGAAPTAGNGITVAQATANSTHDIYIRDWFQRTAITSIVSSSVTGLLGQSFVAQPAGTMNLEYWSGLSLQAQKVRDIVLRRVTSGNGTQLTGGAFALSSGWGTTASVSNIFGQDNAFDLTIASAGTGQAANPTATLTFVDGSWANNWIASLTPVGISSPAGAWVIFSVQSATMGLQFVGTPIAGNSYRVHVVLTGR
ncbi:MAG TPA: hypothetical protein VGH51_02105 [Candidatus Angelobacter sp.]|jgi:hypothetical protein